MSDQDEARGQIEWLDRDNERLRNALASIKQMAICRLSDETFRDLTHPNECLEVIADVAARALVAQAAKDKAA